MQNWADDGSGDCRAEDDRRDAVAVCGRLGLPIHFRDFSRQYWDGVFEHFLAEYAAGRTPNPDVLCNREIKFRHFLDAARELGADCIATGHYARVEQRDGRWQLLRAKDRSKDQSYFLHQLGQAQLSATQFPLGDMLKTDVRRIAAEAGLPTAAKKDSTGICFIGERDFREFLSRYLPAKPGEIRDPQGRVLGEHPGVFYFTLGQREGLQLGGVRGREPAPWYVVGKDVARNVLVRRPGQRQRIPAVAASCGRSPRTGSPAVRRRRASPAPRRRAIGSRRKPATSCARTTAATRSGSPDGSVRSRPGSRWCCTTATSASAARSSPRPMRHSNNRQGTAPHERRCRHTHPWSSACSHWPACCRR